MHSDSRVHRVESAAALISAHGAHAASFSLVLKNSGAPRGSIYHHFPEGKRQLTEEAMRLASSRVLEYQRQLIATTPLEVLNHFIALWRSVVVASDGARGCAIAGVAVDADSPSDSLIDVAAEIFRSWTSLLKEQLIATGSDEDNAAALAVTTLAALEGALILCRSERNVIPLDTVAAQLRRLAT